MRETIGDIEMGQKKDPRCRVKSQLQSPLLALPPEIRLQIFRYALLKPGSIDLWPHKWLTKEEIEIQKLRKPGQSSAFTLKVRRQEDLEYVRKEMALGLLGTCVQVYEEAAALFWSENRFRFSGRSGWQGLLRFYLTIGPSARSRIRTLDLHAPIYMRWPHKDRDNKDMNGRSKNFPKMRLAQIPEEGHLDRQAIQRVCVLLAQDRALESINFIVPDGFRNGDENFFGGYQEDHDDDTEVGRLRLDRIRGLDFVKKTVVVEKGGYLAVQEGPRQILNEGWDLICDPGSFIWEKNDAGDKHGNADYEKHDVVERRTWIAPARKWDYLEGVSKLLADDEVISVHANGGRQKNGRVKKLERALTAFSTPPPPPSPPSSSSTSASKADSSPSAAEEAGTATLEDDEAVVDDVGKKGKRSRRKSGETNFQQDGIEHEATGDAVSTEQVTS